MFKCFVAVCAALLVLCLPSLKAQPFSIAYQTPDQLVVCASDTLFLTVQNNTGTVAFGATLELELPAGLQYMAGTIVGATDFDLSDLEKPRFTLPDMAAGASVQVRVELYATCGLVEAINSAQLFSAVLRVRAGALANQVTTTKFQIQTSLLVITQVDNKVFSGEKGDMFVRTLHVRNTRLGPVRHLFLRDKNLGGIHISTTGPVWEDNDTVQFLYTAYYDGAFFTQFGNGDTLFDFGETILIHQKITITDCGMPEYTDRSNIVVSWSCDALEPPCQGDSTFADVHVKESKYLPELNILGTYPNPWDRCGLEPVVGTFQVVNYGPAPAEQVLINITLPGSFGAAGIDPLSLRMIYKGVVTPITPNLYDTIVSPQCNQVYSTDIIFYIPIVPAFDTVQIHYDFYYCTDECQLVTPLVTINHFYRVECPPGGTKSSVNLVQSAPGDALLARVRYDIRECLDDGATYDFFLDITSNRLLGDTGFVWVELDLPWGLFWSPDCPPLLDNQSPFSFSIDTISGYQRVTMGFALPLSSSKVELPFCLRSTCLDDAAFQNFGLVGNGTPDLNGLFNAFVINPPDTCTNCGYVGLAKVKLTRNPDDDLDCAFTVCDGFQLLTSCTEWPGCNVLGEQQCSDWSGVEVRQYFDAKRTNLGLPDNDDNRRADASGALDLTKIRRDRFIPGDTLQATVSTKIVQGSNIPSIFYQMFVEVVRSNFGYAGIFDTIEIGPGMLSGARGFLANADSFKLVDYELEIWDSTANATYTCTFPANLNRHLLFGNMTPVNVKPFAPSDQLTSMSHTFRPNFSALASTGCLPQGFTLNTGDSVVLRTIWKLNFNFNRTPFANQPVPPLVHFELGLNAGLKDAPADWNYRRCDTLMLQYSGFVDSLTAGTFGIRPCETSQQATPFAYNIRLARPNLFPYEVRPLSVISDYTMIMPSGIVPNTARLLFLSLQTGPPLLQNLDLPFSVVPDSAFSVDFSAAYAEPIDEGYGLRTLWVFDPSCAFTAPDSSAQHITLDFTGCINKGVPRLDTLERQIGFFSNHPRDTITTAELQYFFTTGAISVDMLLRNLAPAVAHNYWINLVNPEGGLTNLTITNTGNGTVFTPTNGIFQLGNLLQLGQQNLRIQATNISCEPQRLLVIYGWDCQPYTVPGAPSCGKDTLEILLRPRQPEIELELINLPANIPLCDTSDYFVLELSNADLGHAYQPFVNIELPPGFQFLPGSCQMSYPAGNAYIPIPDPTDMGNGLLEWNIAALQAAVAANGLPGVNTNPQNSLRIRFRVVAECGVVSNAQLIFGARAEWYCGRPTNILRKASDPILVEGTAPTYAVQVNANEPTGAPVPCGAERTVTVSLLLSGPALPGDSVYVDLPAGYTYVPGSYQPGPNALPSGPQVTGNVLRWALPVALPANTIVQFSFRILSGDQPNCGGNFVRVEARQRTAAFCPLLQDFCTIYVVTGNALMPLPPYIPNLSIAAATGSISGTGMGMYTVQIANGGTLPGFVSTVQLVRDVDGDGKLSAADTLFWADFPGLVLQPGGTLTLNLTSDNPVDLCNLLVVLPAAENCACETLVAPLQIEAVTYLPQAICLGESVPVGLPGGPMGGHTYAWTGAPDLPCTDCPQFDYTPTTAGAYTLTLTDAGAVCTVTHVFPIQVNTAPTLLPAASTICRGETVVLQTSPAATWQWQGPGIGNPTASTQTVQPAQSATYYVTATNAAGCVLTDSFSIVVLSTDTTDLGTWRTCEGTPVDIFGTPTDEAGLYSQILTNTSGCDSLLLLRLIVTPNTEEHIARCVPDVVIVFGQAVSQPGLYCQTFESSLGCDSTHCITVSDLPVPDLPEEADTLYFAPGATVTLPGPTGYAAYEWIPTTGLSCADCPNPTVTPADTATYTLIVYTGDNCPDTVTYRLFPLPPCDPARIRVPNAFTPDGDGVNDTFAPVPYEGVEIVARLTIYNRWGQKIYEATGPNAAWDGTTFGQPAPSDVYVWLLEVLCSGDNERKFRKGDVTVMR